MRQMLHRAFINLELINRRCLIFHHDNGRSHISLVIHQKLREFDQEVLIHLSYSPGLLPSDFHLLRSFQNSLGSIKLTPRENYLFNRCGPFGPNLVPGMCRDSGEGILFLPSTGVARPLCELWPEAKGLVQWL